MKFLIRHPVFVLMLAGASTLSYMVYAKVAEEPVARSGFAGSFGAAPIVGLTPVALQVIADDVESVGTAIANESVELTSKVAEPIFKVDFEDGDYVERGEVLVELVNAAEASRLSEAQATVNDAQRQLQRVENLSSSNLVADSELDQARTNLETAQARLEGVMVAMDDRLVRAPFSGFLGFRNVSEGSLLSPSTVITTLDDVSQIKLDFTVPEIHLADLGAGQPIQANSIVYDDEVFEGTISVIGSRIDPVTRGVQVRAVIDNAELKLRPGMLMTVSLALNEKEVMVVPERAIVASQGRQYAFSVDADNKVSRKQVELGRRRDGLVEIVSGLEVGERVVSEGTIRVRPGLTVQPQGGSQDGAEESAPASAAPKGRPSYPGSEGS